MGDGHTRKLVCRGSIQWRERTRENERVRRAPGPAAIIPTVKNASDLPAALRRRSGTSGCLKLKKGQHHCQRRTAQGFIVLFVFFCYLPDDRVSGCLISAVGDKAHGCWAAQRLHPGPPALNTGMGHLNCPEPHTQAHPHARHIPSIAP